MRSDLKTIVLDQLESLMHNAKDMNQTRVFCWAKGLHDIVNEWPDYYYLQPERLDAELVTKLGDAVADLLNLKHHVNASLSRIYDTSWGTKTPEGLGRSIVRLVNEVIIRELK